MLVELFLQFGLFGDEGVEVGIGFGEFGVDLIEAREHFNDGLHRFFHDLDDGFCFIELGFLLEVAVGVALGLRDLADVQELIKARALDREFANRLDPSVREKYLELYLAVAEAPDQE